MLIFFFLKIIYFFSSSDENRRSRHSRPPSPHSARISGTHDSLNTSWSDSHGSQESLPPLPPRGMSQSAFVLDKFLYKFSSCYILLSCCFMYVWWRLMLDKMCWGTYLFSCKCMQDWQQDQEVVYIVYIKEKMHIIENNYVLHKI